MQYDQRTLGAVIERNDYDRGASEAFVHEDERLSFHDYAVRARRLAAAIFKLGVARQERVALLSMNCLAPYEIFGACEIAGFIPVPINFRLAGPEIAAVLADAAPSVLFFQSRYTAAIELLRAQLPSGLRYVCIDGAVAWALPYEALLQSGSAEGPPIRARRDDYAHIFYTSGTTGKPKGVVHTHAGVCDWLTVTALVGEFTAASTILQTSPTFHVGGKIYVAAAAFVGGRSVIHNGFDALKVLAAIERERVTFTFMVAAMIEAILAVPNTRDYDLSSIHKIICAAAPITVPLLRRAIDLMGPVFAVQYGSTETGNLGNLWRHEMSPDGTAAQVARLASVGRPVPGVALRIIDEAGRNCVDQSSGEVIVQTPSLMTGYWRNEEATAAAVREGWYHTGDIGFRDAEGYLFLVDRKKDMIISGGENIYSREVESAILEHPLVADAAVIGVADPRWGEAVCAIIVLKANAELSSAGLSDHLRKLIAGYKIPKHTVFTRELPYLPSGKINKVALRQTYASSKVSA